jgi:hypothetical protein
VSQEERPEHRDHVELPPPDPLPDDPKLVTLTAGAEILRIFSPEPFGYTAVSFRNFGPALRFDHQRAPITDPSEDADRGIWYGALLIQPEGAESALHTCLRECFQKVRRVDPNAHLGRVRVTDRDELRLLSLVDRGATRAGTITQMPASSDARKSQAWSRYFYETPGIFGEPDGLLYRSTYNGSLNVALYERASDALEPHPARESLRLSYGALRSTVAEFAVANGWSLATVDL